MQVWAVSFSTGQLSPISPSPLSKIFGILSLVGTSNLRHAFHPVSLPPKITKEGYTNIYFGENQLSLGSLGISPLISSHLMSLQRQRVRASCRISTAFTLLKISSPRFGSNVTRAPASRKRSIKTRFRYAFPRSTWLNRACTFTRRIILQ